MILGGVLNRESSVGYVVEQEDECGCQGAFDGRTRPPTIIVDDHGSDLSEFLLLSWAICVFPSTATRRKWLKPEDGPDRRFAGRAVLLSALV
jgi:hypothetical protein